jgi:hypothetical protein
MTKVIGIRVNICQFYTYIVFFKKKSLNIFLLIKIIRIEVFRETIYILFKLFTLSFNRYNTILN